MQDRGVGKGPGLGWQCQLLRLPGPEEPGAGSQKGSPGPGGDRSQASQVLSASKACLLAVVGELVAWTAVGSRQGLPTGYGAGMHQGLYLQVRAHMCTGRYP